MITTATIFPVKRTTLSLAAFLLATLACSAELVTAFTYQGRLADTNGPVNGNYDFVFGLYDADTNQIGSLLTNSRVPVVEGEFTLTLDFGPNSFKRVLAMPRGFEGPGEWLEIRMRQSSGHPGAFVTLAPRQPLTPTPYAAALTAPLLSGALEGNYNGKVNFGNSSNVFVGAYYGDGANLTNLSYTGIWKLTGNTATSPGANFLGTADAQPLELKVNSQRALRLEPNATSPNVIGGYAGNFVGGGYYGAVVAGGGASADTNLVKGNYGVVSGGSGNVADSSWSTVGGGRGNTVQAGSSFATIAGGSANIAAANAGYSFIGGGIANTASGEKATVGGGSFNQVVGDFGSIGGGERNLATNHAAISGGLRNQATGGYAAIGGGRTNSASGNSSAVGGGLGNSADGIYATVSGGRYNVADGTHSSVAGGWAGQASGGYSMVAGGSHNAAQGSYSFAAGYYATAAHDRSFIWNGVPGNARSTTGDQRFEIHAPGGAYFHTDTNALYASGDMSCATLTIRGGADLAEPFAVSGDDIPAGAVVVIDEQNPGRLKLSNEAYDQKVAGIVSGAGGVQPGISMIQAEKLEGGRNVALSGRVYALVDATDHPVRPGDLLTTSATPGHAMKATRLAQAQGAILGKAMTPLPGGRGLVLVLVNLQ